MAPFIILIVSFFILRITGVLRITYFDGWETSLRGAVALMFLFTATAHWGKRRPDLIKTGTSECAKHSAHGDDYGNT